MIEYQIPKKEIEIMVTLINPNRDIIEIKNPMIKKDDLIKNSNLEFNFLMNKKLKNLMLS
jgi:hypothetical protein